MNVGKTKNTKQRYVKNTHLLKANMVFIHYRYTLYCVPLNADTQPFGNKQSFQRNGKLVYNITNNLLNY